MRRARTVLLAAMVVLPLTGATAPPQQPVFAHGEAQPVFDPADVVREKVFVRAPIDSDRDGKDDEVRTEVLRLRATNQSLKSPVIFRISPYFGGGQRPPKHNVDVDLYVPGWPRRPDRRDVPDAGPEKDPRVSAALGSSGPSPRDIPEHADEKYYLARGYALVYADSLGTGESTGCPTSGGRNETIGARSVVDWLNGRTTARDINNKPSVASWTTGKTAMTGLSYNGTLPNAVASTGVKGLEAIVPMAAISRWYDYYRAGGAVVAPGAYQGEDADWLATRVNSRADREICKPVINELTEKQDRLTGDYSPFWDERNYLNDANKVRAATLIAHGLNDWNVKTKQAAQWYSALKANKVPVKIWWHRHEHGDPVNVRKEEWQKALNRWFTRYLFGHQNNVEAEPRVTIQREDNSWATEADWPVPGSSDVSLHPQPGGAATGGLGLKPARGVEKLVDDASKKVEQLITLPNSDTRLAYATPAAKRALRVSGAIKAELELSFDRPAANVTAVLVDRAPDGTAKVITRGWADPQNRGRLDRTEPVKPGEQYSLTVELQPMDHVLPAGNKLELVVLSSDRDYTLRPRPGAGIAVALDHTRLVVPVLGGKAAFVAAFGP
ncbi:Xaa-Pro dipeptidyl-peptidase [Allokutzneria albata]|uniref:Xaa-Pro dipeptidyl-peptidase n=1 Tax=Allokutzneria albata TaxID=211114 RepID=A0A1H0B2M4_ALLAB|nr:Xaa-Pro dipeptidyl-peptidase [Allokutzneria albata]SDN39890.1 dipeptidyl-peptidase IV Serine peptidase. MEROPS family S15 [Allokutzneria albata]